MFSQHNWIKLRLQLFHREKYISHFFMQVFFHPENCKSKGRRGEKGTIQGVGRLGQRDTIKDKRESQNQV